MLFPQTVVKSRNKSGNSPKFMIQIKPTPHVKYYFELHMNKCSVICSADYNQVLCIPKSNTTMQ